jgi:hypothetical protein
VTLLSFILPGFCLEQEPEVMDMAITHGAQDGSFMRRKGRQLAPLRTPVDLGAVNEILDFSSATTPPPFDANDQGGTGSVEQRANVVLDEKIRVCRVETLLSDRFTAIFSEPGEVDQRVRFMRGRVASSDRSLLREGAVFYWIIGTERDPSGDLISTSFIRFRRTPQLSPRQLHRLDDLAEEAILAGGGVPIDDEELNARLSQALREDGGTARQE